MRMPSFTAFKFPSLASISMVELGSTSRRQPFMQNKGR